MTNPHIEAAKRASQVLYNSVLNDLDEDKAGIGWMTDQINWKHSALIEGVRKFVCEALI